MVFLIHTELRCTVNHTSVWHKPLLHVQWKTHYYWQRNRPKHVEFYSKNKFDKLVQLFGFIKRNFFLVNAMNSYEKSEKFLHSFLISWGEANWRISSLSVTHIKQSSQKCGARIRIRTTRLRPYVLRRRRSPVLVANIHCVQFTRLNTQSILITWKSSTFYDMSGVSFILKLICNSTSSTVNKRLAWRSGWMKD